MNRFKNIAIAVFLLSTLMVSAQEQQEPEKDNRPVKDMFGNGLMFDQQTVKSAMPGSFEFVIQHRFGTTKNGIKDLYGIYASSNVRLGLNYGITDNIMIGFGTTRYYKLQDFNWKIAFFKQTRSGSTPLSLTYYGNVVLDARSIDNFGPAASYKFSHRLSYFNQLIFARKFSDNLSLLVAPSMANFNAVNTGYKNANYSLSFGGKLKITDKMNFIVGYDIPFAGKKDSTMFKPEPNLSFGLEMGSPTHTFQIFVTNSDYLVNQYGLSLNTNSIKNNGLLVGLNITVRF